MEDSKFSILLVDDEKTNLNVLNHILKTEYTVYIAKSGEAALKRAREYKPDLILLDILMPDMSGFDVLRTLKDWDETREIPVIFITGLSNAEDEEKGFMLGAVDYITKPFNNSIVKARVKTHLRIIKQMRTIEHLGLVDALTEIANRRCFDNQINTEWQRAIRENSYISLLMIDVDKFKRYNDTYGHPQGDVLLQRLAKIFSACAKRQTDLTARFGGEEFVVLLPNTELKGGFEVAEKIRRTVEDEKVPHEGIGKDTVVTVSIGVASVIPNVDSKISDFISAADSALYKAKREGRNRVCT